MQEVIKAFVEMIEDDCNHAQDLLSSGARETLAYDITCYKQIIESHEYQALKSLVEPIPDAQSNDGWIKHFGGKMPVHADSIVEVKFQGGSTERGFCASEWGWEWAQSSGDIIAYRIIDEPKEGEPKKQTLEDYRILVDTIARLEVRIAHLEQNKVDK